MVVDSFNQRKKDILSKEDKSSIGEWDKKIVPLCDEINSLNNYYTTSSCSGRVVLMVDQEKKAENLFLAVSHDLISFEWLKNNLEDLKSKNILIKFKLEPPILHVACKDLESASSLLEKAKKIGWKRSGINAFGKNIVLELNSTDMLEFPIIKSGEVLVRDSFLQLIIEQSNRKLERGWGKIEKLMQEISFL